MALCKRMRTPNNDERAHLYQKLQNKFADGRMKSERLVVARIQRQACCDRQRLEKKVEAFTQRCRRNLPR
ncbi:Hypothetical protein SMAX5B_009049 [Scophthalmus maximus]|uniref:Uncharacterized protein n=1 Tax=Scophthalmus maximus TaxID=52904 RepID=A0A2U9CJR6_SCOMX|nr:Hypothetical protein SMAX5B_009049 [Scophthalmus maximus]